MRPRIAWTIFCKEITEALRDRVTLMVVLGLPLLVYPLLITGISKMQKTQAAAEDKRPSRIVLWGDTSPRLLEWLQQTNLLKLETEYAPTADAKAELEADPPWLETNTVARSKAVASTNAEPDSALTLAARELIADRKVDAVLAIWPGLSKALDQNGLGRLSIFYDSVRPASQKARDRLADSLNSLRHALIQERERKLGLLKGFSSALETRNENIAPPRRRAGHLLSVGLPFILIMLSATGALYGAIDLTAGEKDRVTMQTLLCAPVHSLEIVAGKFLTVWAISFIAATANATSLSLTIGRVAASVGGLSLSPTTMLLVLPCLLPVTCTIAALFLAVAVLARDAKDAGNFLGATLTILMLPMATTFVPGIELNGATLFVPLVNIALLIKALFVGEAKIELVFLTLIASAAYATLALLFAARVFSREQILLGGKGSVQSLFRSERPRHQPPTPATALIVFIVALVAAFYGSLAIERIGLIPAILLNMYGAMLLPVVVATAINRFPLRETFSLRVPHWRGALGAILVGVSGGVAIAGLALRLLPAPESMVEGMRELLLLGDPPKPLWIAWLVLAVSPGICEESLFRGLIFRGFLRSGPWTAILVSSLLFGLAHASIYRLLPTFGLGLLMALTVCRTRSIYCSMAIHALNNGLVATLVHWHARTGRFDFTKLASVPWSITLAALATTLLGLWLMRPPPGDAFTSKNGRNAADRGL